MGRTPFFRKSIELEHHFSNIERTQTCSLIGDRNWTHFFGFKTIEHGTSNLIGPSLDLLSYFLNRSEQCIFDIERIRSCSSFDNRTRTSYFWLRTIEFQIRPTTKKFSVVYLILSNHNLFPFVFNLFFFFFENVMLSVDAYSVSHFTSNWQETKFGFYLE